MRTNPRACSLLLVISALVFSGWGIYMETIRAENPPALGKEVEVLIVPGQNAAEVAAEFERAGAVVKSRDLATWMARIGIDRKIKPGVYRIVAGRPKDVAQAIKDATPDVLNIRILPGALFAEIAREFGQNNADILLAEALEHAENYPERMRRLLPKGAEERVVFLSPETYAVPPGEGAADNLVRVATKTWWRQHAEYIPDDLTSKDIRADGILASIVQKEALFDEERPVIAGVFKNRLEKGMPLQSCATVVHAWRLKNVKITTVSFDDTKVKSPYNTYLHKGLPPDNIGVPSVSSWNAVLKPAATDKFFFVAKRDGRHVFTRTYKEHLDAQRKIRRGEL